MVKKYFVAAGYGDGSKQENLLLLEMDEGGTMQIRQKIYCEGGPSYLTAKVGSDNKSYIYAALEHANEIVRFVLEKGKLVEQKRLRVPGEGLCHLCMSENETMIYGSCYVSGSYFAVPAELNKCVWKLEGKENSHAHCVCQGKNHQIYMVDLGASSVCGYRHSQKTLSKVNIRFSIHEDEGPRQILLWNSEKNAVIINEKAGTLSFWKIEKQENKKWIRRICTKYTTAYADYNAPGDAVIWKDKILFVGNRGAETISAFSLERIGEKIGEWDCGGTFPRGLTVSDTGILLSACQKSGDIISYQWNGQEDGIRICDSVNLPGAASVIEITIKEDDL